MHKFLIYFLLFTSILQDNNSECEVRNFLSCRTHFNIQTLILQTKKLTDVSVPHSLSRSREDTESLIYLIYEF